MDKLQELLDVGIEKISKLSEAEMTHKISLEKWSKKEILGHLIDSGINNLQRFTEIQFAKSSYKIRNYNQEELVKANNYQNSETKELLLFWLSINNRILHVFSLQTEKTLNYKIVFEDGSTADLKFLMEDYVNHLAHHLNQILN